MSDKTATIYADLAARVIEQMENNPGDWTKPWRNLGRPQNAVSGHVFTGGNAMFLWYLSSDREYSSPSWATYKQWASVGAQVRKGEKGVGLIRVASLVRCADPSCNWKSRKGEPRCPKHGSSKRIQYPVAFTAFHASQVDGAEKAPHYVAEATTNIDTVESIAGAEKFFRSVGSRWYEGMGDQAFYAPQRDEITVPYRSQFRDLASFYAVLGHEHVHWTGAESRMSRPGIVEFDHFGSEQYAREELVAELGSLFLCADLGLSSEPRPDHAQYLANWIARIKEDPQALWTAASHAEKAVRFLHEQVDGKTEEAQQQQAV